MQLIFFLFVFFTIGCLFYGISAGVQTMQRGVGRLAGNKYDNAATATQPMPAAQLSDAKASPLQCSISELREIFSLHREGALTKEEFEQMKQHLLSGIPLPAADTTREAP